MKFVYALEKGIKHERQFKLFLAGGTPRVQGQPSWRTDALAILSEIKDSEPTDEIYIPEPRDGVWHNQYDNQVNWELEHLELADVILFWMPRNMETLPSLTSNVEFGLYAKSGKIVLGVPDYAVHCNYLKYLAKLNKVPVSNTLEETIQSAYRLYRTC